MRDGTIPSLPGPSLFFNRIVYGAQLSGHVRLVAVSFVRKDDDGAVEAELWAFKRLGKHPHLTQLVGISEDPSNGRTVLVTEYAVLAYIYLCLYMCGRATHFVCDRHTICAYACGCLCVSRAVFVTEHVVFDIAY
jgi:hypothetical protein